MRDERLAVSDDYSLCRMRSLLLHATRTKTSKISSLNHILKAVDVEPVPRRIEDTDGILSFQQFLEQLRNTGLAVAWVGEEFRDDVGDECGGNGRHFEEPHPDPVDGCLREVVPQLLEIDLVVKGLSRIGNAAFGEPAKASIAALFLPVAIDENDTVFLLLTEGLGNVFIEQDVAV